MHTFWICMNEEQRNLLIEALMQNSETNEEARLLLSMLHDAQPFPIINNFME